MRLRKDERVDRLARVPLFATCSKTDLTRVAGIADELDLREGKVLTRQGGPALGFYVLLEGSVEVARDGKSIAAMGPGDFFGETALISRKPRNATVTATSPLRVLVITETNFRRLLREEPGIARKLLQAVAERLPAGV